MILANAILRLLFFWTNKRSSAPATRLTRDGFTRLVMSFTGEKAATFEKQHYNVLQSIRNLNCSDLFSQTNFRFAVFLDEQEKQRPCYEMLLGHGASVHCRKKSTDCAINLS
jgi:phage regulator Rha-like protein